MGLLRASSADAPLSELTKAFPLKATATGLTGVIVSLSQSSREAHLDDYLSVCSLDAGCEERRRMTSRISVCDGLVTGVTDFGQILACWWLC